MKVFMILIQTLFLCALYELGKWLEESFSLPIPGSIIGMILLFLILSTGKVSEKWLQPALGFILKHLSFFFIPLTVGVIAIASDLVKIGWELMLILVASGLLGIMATSIATNLVAKKKDVSNE